MADLTAPGPGGDERWRQTLPHAPPPGRGGTTILQAK
jgi:hypothetical protein